MAISMAKLRDGAARAHGSASEDVSVYLSVLDMLAYNPAMTMQVAEQLIEAGIRPQPVKSSDEWASLGYWVDGKAQGVGVIGPDGSALELHPLESTELNLFSTDFDDGSWLRRDIDANRGGLDAPSYIDQVLRQAEFPNDGDALIFASARYIALRRYAHDMSLSEAGGLVESAFSGMGDGYVDQFDLLISQINDRLRGGISDEPRAQARADAGAAQPPTLIFMSEARERGASGVSDDGLLQASLFSASVEAPSPEPVASPTETSSAVIAADAPAAEQPSEEEPPAPPVIVEDEPVARINWSAPIVEEPITAPLDRVRANLDAIRLLRQLEAEGRLATAEEQAILARYVGWGGLSAVFDAQGGGYAEARDELSQLLSPIEMNAARRSTLTAFYTPPIVARAMSDALSRMGFDGGDILEPAMGTGAIIASMPQNLRANSSIYGVELDTISARIAAQLQQGATVVNSGIEATDFTAASFDVVIGNVPFGEFRVFDPDFTEHGFLIHDYFFAKALEEVRPGGIVAFVTSKGTMDKESTAVRRYLAQRAEFLGAIRLPDDTFSRTAGTDVTSDIIFLMRREVPVEEPHDEWIEVVDVPLGPDGRLFPLNAYFSIHPDMVMGHMAVESGPWGDRTSCKPDGRNLQSALGEAIANISATYTPAAKPPVLSSELTREQAEDLAPNSFALIDGNLFFKGTSAVSASSLTGKTRERVISLVRVRDALLELNEAQRTDVDDVRCDALRAALNTAYDGHVDRFGYLSDTMNRRAFEADTRYPLLCSLEIPESDGTGRFRKADVFSRRTMRPAKPVESVETPREALALSLVERGRVDLPYMMSLCGMDRAEVISALEGDIFLDHTTLDWDTPRYLPADEYLSGNIRAKVAEVQSTVLQYPAMADVLRSNGEALAGVMPEDIPPEDIVANLGATWIPSTYVEEFMYETFKTPGYLRRGRSNVFGGGLITVEYNRATGLWNIEHARQHDSVEVGEVWGTSEMSAYDILLATLNLRPIKVMKGILVNTGEGLQEKKVIDRPATAAALAKQESLRVEFREWLFKEEPRRSALAERYNRLFNSHVLRHYDGSSLTFHGMADEIELREHQRDAVARILYSGNTLLGHCVGAGKTFEMVAAAQESKRLGLCSKSMFVVPNHLTGQWGAEYLRLYPNAKVLVTTKRDFEKTRRRQLFGRMMTGDWDAIIIGHSQFTKIPLSAQRQAEFFEAELKDAIDAWERSKLADGESWTVKQYEKKKQRLELKLEELQKRVDEGKDEGICFEDLGVDRLFVDEAHAFKNLGCDTKMGRVAGVSTKASDKCIDLHMKTRYLNELTGERGVVFATGTPISNSIVEMFSMQRYLQPSALAESECSTFDEWASSFAEQVTALEINPTGTGFRNHTRLARFNNLPELMSMFNRVADIKTSEDLQLPVPTAIHHNVVVEPSEAQRAVVVQLGERADLVHSRSVKPEEDNMLKITHEGRLLALDIRTLDAGLPDNPEGKIAACAANVLRIYREHDDIRATQIVFCDISTPDGAGAEQGFSAYSSLKNMLVDGGIPSKEVAFIHDAKTDLQREKMFEMVRAGEVRVLIGSTDKMGTGTNVQDRLIASHDLDCPWRPSDLEQRAGRTIRQGNANDEVGVFRYVTKGTFDSYLYQMVEGKQRFISQIMSGKTGARSTDDVDSTALKYAEIKAAATGDPKIKEKLELDNRISELEMARVAWSKSQAALQVKIDTLPDKISAIQERIDGIGKDIERLDGIEHEGLPVNEDGIRVDTMALAESIEASAHRMLSEGSEKVTLGTYRGFTVTLSRDLFHGDFFATFAGEASYRVPVVLKPSANVRRIDTAMASLSTEKAELEERARAFSEDTETARRSLGKPFAQEGELRRCRERAAELAYLLGTDDDNDAPVVDEAAPPDGGIDIDEFDKNKKAVLRKLMKENKALGGRIPVEMLVASPEVSDVRFETVGDAMLSGCAAEYCDWLLHVNLDSEYQIAKLFRVTRDAPYTAVELEELFDGMSSYVRVNRICDILRGAGDTPPALDVLRSVAQVDFSHVYSQSDLCAIEQDIVSRTAAGKAIDLYFDDAIKTEVAFSYYAALDSGYDFKPLLHSSSMADFDYAERLCRAGATPEQACDLTIESQDGSGAYRELIVRAVKRGLDAEELQGYRNLSWSGLAAAMDEICREPKLSCPAPTTSGLQAPGGGSAHRGR